MNSIEVTLDTFHDPMGWLKAQTLLNMDVISVTFETSHFDISSLKFVLSLNRDLIFVTEDVSQFDMSLYLASAVVLSLHHSLTAVLSVSSLNLNPPFLFYGSLIL